MIFSNKIMVFALILLCGATHLVAHHSSGAGRTVTSRTTSKNAPRGENKNFLQRMFATRRSKIIGGACVAGVAAFCLYAWYNKERPLESIEIGCQQSSKGSECNRWKEVISVPRDMSITVREPYIQKHPVLIRSCSDENTFALCRNDGAYKYLNRDNIKNLLGLFWIPNGWIAGERVKDLISIKKDGGVLRYCKSQEVDQQHAWKSLPEHHVLTHVVSSFVNSGRLNSPKLCNANPICVYPGEQD